MNRDINVPEVRVIHEDGTQLGILRTFDALNRAREDGLDLVLIAETADPPVCKICNAGKFKYQKQQAAKEAARKQRESRVETKILRFRVTTSDNDIERLKKQAQGFLEEGDKVQLEIRMKGRENAHPNLGLDLLREFVQQVPGAVIERQPTLAGKSVMALLGPARQTSTAH